MAEEAFSGCGLMENGGMYMRPYRRGDLEQLYRVDVACFAPRYRFSRAVLRAALEADTAQSILVCEADATGGERILGFCVGSVARDEQGEALGYIATLDVDPTHRRQGLGRLLMTRIEGVLAAAGVSYVLLHATVSNGAALRLYASLGYEIVGRGADGSVANFWFGRIDPESFRWLDVKRAGG